MFATGRSTSHEIRIRLAWNRWTDRRAVDKGPMARFRCTAGGHQDPTNGQAVEERNYLPRRPDQRAPGSRRAGPAPDYRSTLFQARHGHYSMVPRDRRRRGLLENLADPRRLIGAPHVTGLWMQLQVESRRCWAAERTQTIK
jgi:hypothetical protein